MVQMLCGRLDVMQIMWQIVKPCEPMKYLQPFGKVKNTVPPGASMCHPLDTLVQTYPYTPVHRL